MVPRPIPATSVASDVWRITVPLPWRPRSVHAYLARLGGGGWMLVDGGAETDAAWETLDVGVREVAGGWKAIALHMVTHMHVDHIGLAARVRDASGARLAMHHLDAERVAGAAADPEGEAAFRALVLREGGAPPELWSWAEPRPDPARPAPDLPLHGEAGVLTGDWRWLWTPGHTAGHISLLRESDGTLIAGDAVLPHITPTIGVNRQREDAVGDYLEALRRIGETEPRIVLPGHGEAMSPPGPRLRELRDETLAEGRALEELLGTEARTAWEVASKRYANRDLPVSMQLHALRETLAHLRHLELAGRVCSQRREDEAVEFAPM